MKRRKPTNNSKAYAHVLRKRPDLRIVSSGHVLEWTSSGVAEQKPPSDRDLDKMVRDDTIEYYQITAKSSNVAAGGVFDHRAVAKTAEEFGRTEWGIRDLLRKAGRRGLTRARSS